MQHFGSHWKNHCCSSHSIFWLASFKSQAQTYLDTMKWEAKPEEAVVFVPDSRFFLKPKVHSMRMDQSNRPSNIYMLMTIWWRTLKTGSFKLWWQLLKILCHNGSAQFVVEPMYSSNVQVVEIKCKYYSNFTVVVLEHSRFDSGDHTAYSSVCAGESFSDIVELAMQCGLKQPIDPFCVFQSDDGSNVFSTGDMITQYNCHVPLIVFQIISKEELRLFSCHS